MSSLYGELSVFGDLTNVADIAIVPFQIYVLANEKWKGVWCFVSLERTSRTIQMKQFYNDFASLMLRLEVTETTWPMVQKEHCQIIQFHSFLHTFLHPLYYPCYVVHFVQPVPVVPALIQVPCRAGYFWQCSWKLKTSPLPCLIFLAVQLETKNIS